MRRFLTIAALVLVATIAAVAATGVYLSDKIHLRDGHAEVTVEELDREFTPAEIEEDIRLMLDRFRANHPDFASVRGATYRAAAEEFIAGLDEPLTRLELYRSLATLNQHIRDGHTGLRAPLEEHRHYRAEGGRYPAFTVEYDGRALRVEAVGAGEEGLRPDDVIRTINGADAGALAAFALSTQSGEGPAVRRAFMARSFHRALFASGVVSPFTLEVERDGEALTVSSPGLDLAAFQEMVGGSADGGNRLEILDDGAAILTFTDMPSALGPFRNFLDSTFATIDERGIETLVIDQRDATGGDSRAGDALMRYLSPERLPAVERVDVKVTDEIKAYYRTLLPSGFRWIPLHRFVDILDRIQTTESGETFVFRPDPPTPEAWADRPEHAFEGRVVILTSPRTYSSAVIFAAPLKHYGRATFVGEETGEPLVFYGENYVFDLPNTRLQASVSHKRFTLVGAEDEDTGIVPDVEVDEARALEQTRSLIAGSDRDFAGIAERIIGTVRQAAYDPRILAGEEWTSFERAFREQAASARDDLGLLLAFRHALAESRPFSHFDLVVGEGAFEARVRDPGDRASDAPVAAYRSLEPGIGLIDIDSFSGATTGEQIDAAFDAVLEARDEGLIIDLRGNPGGTFQAWPVFARLVEEPTRVGALVSGRWFVDHDAPPSPERLQSDPTISRPVQEALAAGLSDDGLLVLEVEPDPPLFSGPVAVLVDSRSASTSEIVAAALQFTDRAVIVGERSAGEVLNAQFIPVAPGMRLLAPVADFLLPDGSRLEDVGVSPDIDAHADRALDAAIEWLRARARNESGP